MTDNWYHVLELAFDPPVEDEVLIEARIEEKRKFWSTHFNDFQKGAQYRAWHQNIDRIRRDMIGPDNIRAALAEEARQSVYQDIDNRLRVIGRKGNVSEEEGSRLTKRYNVPLETIAQRAKSLGIEWVQGSNTDSQKLYEQYYKNKPRNAAVFENMNQFLAVFGVDNLYDFLFRGTEISFKSRQDTPCDLLVERAKKLKELEFGKTDNISGTGSRLCSQCEIVFKNEESKGVYDAYLEYIQRRRILDDLRDTAADLGGVLSAEIADEFVRMLTRILPDPALVREVLTAFCAVERITLNLNEDSGKNRKVCRCGHINDVSDGRKVCGSCGLDLIIRCPACGAENDAGTRVCKCGFRFDNIDKALALCEQAEHAIERLDFEIAEAQLADACRYWPNSERAAALGTKLNEYQNRAGEELAGLRGAVSGSRYAEAAQRYSVIEKLFPGYCDQPLRGEIAQALSTARNLYEQACDAATEAQTVALCVQVSEICADYPGLRELMMQYPPAPVTGAAVKADPVGRANIVTWQADPADHSVRYVLVRSDSGWVRSIADGETVYTGTANTFRDTGILPGIPYWYNVFAERVGVVSAASGGDLGEIINLFEVSGLSATAEDGRVRIRWDAPAGNAAAEIYDITIDGEQLHRATCRSGEYVIDGLENDVEYCCRVTLSYMTAGRKQETRGLSVSAIPTRPPAPVDSLRVLRAGDGCYDAIWYQPDRADVQLYCAGSKPRYQPGDMVSLAALEAEMTPVEHGPLSCRSSSKLAAGEQGVSFRYSREEQIYLTAVTVKAGTAVVGNTVRITHLKPTAVRSIRVINGRFHLDMDIPAGAAGVYVLYRCDRFPEDESDPAARECQLTHFGGTSYGLVKPNWVEKERYYLSFFTKYRNEGKTEYAPGANYLYDNVPKRTITYSITRTGSWFSARGVELEFTADTQQFDLPDIDILYAIGNTPMFRKSSRLFHFIPGQPVERSLRVQIPLSRKADKDIHIKAFLKNETDQSRYQLQLKVGSVHKIT